MHLSFLETSVGVVHSDLPPPPHGTGDLDPFILLFGHVWSLPHGPLKEASGFQKKRQR